MKPHCLQNVYLYALSFCSRLNHLTIALERGFIMSIAKFDPVADVITKFLNHLSRENPTLCLFVVVFPIVRSLSN